MKTLTAALVLSALMLSACSAGGAQPSAGKPAVQQSADGPTVQVKLLSFEPKEIRITKGQTVTWVGGDAIRHVLVQGQYEVGPDSLRTKETDDKAFSLELARKGQTVRNTYTQAGTFPYYCTIHKGMNGVVIVS